MSDADKVKTMATATATAASADGGDVEEVEDLSEYDDIDPVKDPVSLEEIAKQASSGHAALDELVGGGGGMPSAADVVVVLTEEEQKQKRRKELLSKLKTKRKVARMNVPTTMKRSIMQSSGTASSSMKDATSAFDAGNLKKTAAATLEMIKSAKQQTKTTKISARKQRRMNENNLAGTSGISRMTESLEDVLLS